MSSKKKGITVPLPEFLGDKKITSWAEDEDYDADRKRCLSLTSACHVYHHCRYSRPPAQSSRKMCAVPIAHSPLCRAVPVFPSPSRPGAAAAAEPARNDFTSMPGLPDQPPYKVYLGNVPYELTKEDLSDVFKDLQARYISLFSQLFYWLERHLPLS